MVWTDYSHCSCHFQLVIAQHGGLNLNYVPRTAVFMLEVCAWQILHLIIFRGFWGGFVCVCVSVCVLFLRFSVFWFQVVGKLAWPRQLPTRAIPARLRPLLLPPVQCWPLHVHRQQLRLDGDEGRAGPTAGQLSLPAAAGIHVPTHSTAHHAAVSSFVLAGVVFITCVLSLMSLQIPHTFRLPGLWASSAGKQASFWSPA